jgi:5'-methylthioadenosine phosphorylase
LLEATASDSAIAKYVEKRGPGIHHITLRVDDIGAVLDRLKARGVRLVDEQPRPGRRRFAGRVHPSVGGARRARRTEAERFLMQRAQIGIIGGSGLYDMAGVTEREEVKVATPFGEPSAPYVLGTLRGKRVAFLARHGGGHRVSPSELNFRANIFGMKALGVEFILSASAVGSLKEEYKPADIVIPDQFFDRTKGGRAASFGAGSSARRLRASVLQDPQRHRLRERRQAGATDHKGGTYVCMEGPQFSTLAESKLYRSWGMDIIGMTNLQEAKLAREAEICYTTIALVTDYDCWHPDHDSVTVEMVMSTLAKTPRRRSRSSRARSSSCRTSARASAHRAEVRARHASRRWCPIRSRRISRPISNRPQITHPIHETHRHRFDCLRLPDAVPGKFTEHILPEHLQRVSLSFLVDRWTSGAAAARRTSPTRWRCSASGRICGDGGQDFKEYDEWLQAAGVDTSHRAHVPTSSPRRSSAAPIPRTTRLRRSTSARWRMRRSCRCARSAAGLVIISPNDPGAMVQYAEECRTIGVPFIFDPGQQCARLSATNCATASRRAAGHLQRLRVRADSQKTGSARTASSSRRRARHYARGRRVLDLRGQAAAPDVKALSRRTASSIRQASATRSAAVDERDGVGKSLKECAQLGTVAAPTRSSTSGDRATHTPCRSFRETVRRSISGR